MNAVVSLDQDNSMVPGFLISIALNFVASSIGEERQCCVLDNNPEELIMKLQTPLVYLAARNDEFCPLTKARSLFNNHKGTLSIKR